MRGLMQRYAGVWMACLGLVLSGCQGLKLFEKDTEKNPSVCLEFVDISLDSDANQDSAISVDVLVVYKDELMKALMKMKAADYFASRIQILRDYPDMVDMWHWELTPGQVVRDYPITQRSDAPVGAVIFADYFAPGDHRIRFASEGHAHVRMKKFDFCVLEQGCSGDLSNQSIASRQDKEDAKESAMKGALPKSSQGSSNPAQELKKEVSSVKSEISSLKQLLK